MTQVICPDCENTGICEEHPYGGGYVAQTQHTPGPWFYDGQNGCGAHVIHVAQGEIAEAFGDSWSDDGQQAEANAHLIAAAPDLLAALEDALKAVDDLVLAIDVEGVAHRCPNTLKYSDRVAAKAAAAITKAKGGAA